MTVDIVGGDRLLDPGEIELTQPLGAADRFVDAEPLVGVGHDLIAIADGLADSFKARDVLRAVRLADLDL